MSSHTSHHWKRLCQRCEHHVYIMLSKTSVFIFYYLNDKAFPALGHPPPSPTGPTATRHQPHSTIVSSPPHPNVTGFHCWQYNSPEPHFVSTPPLASNVTTYCVFQFQSMRIGSARPPFKHETSSQPLLYYYFGFTYNRQNTSYHNPFTHGLPNSIPFRPLAHPRPFPRIHLPRLGHIYILAWHEHTQTQTHTHTPSLYLF